MKIPTQDEHTVPKDMQVLQRFKKYKEVKDIKKSFEFGRLLGKGAYGEVYLVTDQKLKIKCALKKINKELLEDDPVQEQLMKDEIATIQNITHPNLMRVYELL